MTDMTDPTSPTSPTSLAATNTAMSISWDDVEYPLEFEEMVHRVSSGETMELAVSWERDLDAIVMLNQRTQLDSELVLYGRMLRRQLVLDQEIMLACCFRRGCFITPEFLRWLWVELRPLYEKTRQVQEEYLASCVARCDRVIGDATPSTTTPFSWPHDELWDALFCDETIDTDACRLIGEDDMLVA